MTLSWRQWVFAGFVAVQGLVPIRALVGEGHESRTDFTWDMFAVRRDCSECTVWYVIGDGEQQRVSWGLRSPALPPIVVQGRSADSAPPLLERLWNGPDIDSAHIEAFENFETYGAGALMAHPSMPAVNVRAAPQVARLKSTTRLERLGADLCVSLEQQFESALAGEPVVDWVRRDAQRWEAAGRVLRVEASCRCAYNNAPEIDVIDPEQNLCAP